MKFGMLTEELRRPDPDSLFKAISGYGFTTVQWDFLSVCDEEMPAYLDDDVIDSIVNAAKKYNVTFEALTGTFNMAHVDQKVREDGLKRLEYMASIADRFDCSLLTLCCGSRDDDMWTIHPDNDTPEAWNDMMWSMERAVAIADRYDKKLGIEIEASNVVHTAQQARKLFDDIGSSRLGLILDGANLYPNGMLSQEDVRRIMAETFELMGDRVVLAHGKDLKRGPGVEFTYAGNGIVDFPFFVEQLNAIGYKGTIVMHGMTKEEEFPKAMALMAELVG